MLNARVSVQLQRVIGLPKERDLLGDLAGGLGVAFCAVMGAAPEQGFVTFSVLFSLTWLFLLELLKRFGGGSNGLLRKVSASLAPFCQMGRYWPVFFFVSLVSGQETSRWWQSIYVSGWGMSGILRAIYVFFAGNLLLLLLECIGRLFGLGDAASSGADPGSEGPLSILRLSGRDAMLGEILALVIFGALFLRRFFDTSMITELAQVLGWWDQIEKITRILFRVGMCVGILSLGALAESAVRSGEGKAASPADAQKQVKEHAALALAGGLMFLAVWLHQTYLQGYDIELLYFGIFFTLVAGRKADRFVRLSVILSVLVLIAAWKLSLEGYVKYLVYAGSKHAMGMVYSTDLAAHLFGLVAAGCFLRRGKVSPTRFLFYVFVAEYFIWHITGCRNDTLAVALLLIGTFVYMFFDKAFLLLCRFFRYVLKYVFPILFFGSLLMTCYYNDERMRGIPGMGTLAERFVLGRRGFEQYPVTLIGTIVSENGAGGTVEASEYFFIDSSYVRMLLLYGILITAAFLAAMTLYQHRSLESGLPYVAFVCAVFALTAFVDHHILDPSYFILGILPLARTDAEPDPTLWMRLTEKRKRKR